MTATDAARMATGPADRRTLLVISQVYPPDPTAVGQYYAEVAEEAVRRGWRVVVYTANRGYDDPRVRYPAREMLRGVDVRRLCWSSFGKSSLAIRLVAHTLFLAQATVRALFLSRLSTVLVSTSPPFAGAAGALVARLRRARLLWWVMDLNPDQLVAAGRASPGALSVRVFDRLNRFTLRHADAVVTLDHVMQQRLLAKLPVPEKIHVIPPWPLDAPARAQATDGVPFRRLHGLEEQFVVMYSGNHSLQNPLDTLLAAARELRGHEDISFLFIGGGTGKKAVDDLAASGEAHVLSLPYQHRDHVHAALAAADLQVVAVGDAMIGILHPCKIYTVMGVGRPILVLGSRKSPAGQLVMRHSLGWCVEHGDVSGVVNAIVTARDLRGSELEAMGRRSAALAAAEFSRNSLVDRFCALLFAGPRAARCQGGEGVRTTPPSTP